jgi:hypothetical protein
MGAVAWVRIVSGVARLIANHLHLTIVESAKKSGSFAPSPLHGVGAPTTLFDSRCDRHVLRR